MKSHDQSIFVSEKEIIGFKLTDLLGMVIMTVPFIISILFNHIDPGIKIWFLRLTPDKNTNIRPGLVAAMCAALFYAALIARYDGIFRAKNLLEAIVSIIRAFLNCWVIAAIISLVIPTTISKNSTLISVFINNPESVLLLLAIILSWLGMKTIAGYSWILFIIAAWKHLLIVNSVMNMWGAVFILTFAISLFLQLKDYSTIRDFAQEFRTRITPMMGNIKQDINASVGDASRKIQASGDLIKENVRAFTNIKIPSSSNRPEQASGVTINLEALDLNKDGVVDERDFMLLNHNRQDTK